MIVLKKEDSLKILSKIYKNKIVHGSMWFIDDTLSKNKKYYNGEIIKLGNPRVQLFYGQEIFEYFDIVDVWCEIETNLKTLRQENSNEVISIPDFDTSDVIYNVLLKLPDKEWNKLMSESKIYNLLRSELFPTGYNIQRAKRVRK